MKKIYSFLLLCAGVLLFTSCLSVAPTSISRNGSLEGYRYFYVTPTAERSSVNGDTWGTRGNTYGTTTSSSVNPADLIAGYLMGRGYVRVPEVKKEDAAQTMVINYGDGNMREGVFFDQRAVEVTIQILNGQTNGLICVCKAEEKSNNEAKATRRAIEKALNEIFNGVR